jgi:phage terminase Nu1 subunit (DNA packaging protein)
MALPKTVDTDELAQVLGVDDRTVRRLVKKGVLARSAQGFELADAIKCYVTHRESVAAEQAGAGEYGKARTELVKEQVRKAKREREIAEGAFMAIDEVHDTWAKVTVLIRNRFMALPVRSAPLLVGLKNPIEAQLILDPMVREILTELAQTEIEPISPKKSAA